MLQGTSVAIAAEDREPQFLLEVDYSTNVLPYIKNLYEIELSDHSLYKVHVQISSAAFVKNIW